MWRWLLIVIALVLAPCGAEAADLFGNYSGLADSGPSYTTVYVDENGYIVGVNAVGPVTPRLGHYGQAFRLDMLPHGAMSFGSIRVVPNRSLHPAGAYGY